MRHLMPHPQHRRSVSDRVRKLVTYGWLIASLALPVAGIALISQGVTGLAPAGDGLTHTVQSGETLTGIALRYGVTVDELVQANGLANANQIYVGDQLVIPRTVDDSGAKVHTVQQGESLYMISRRYGVPIDQLISVNGLSDPNRLSVGQRLAIPGGVAAAPDSGLQPNPSPSSNNSVTYTLRRGDSLYRVSLIFGVTVDDLMAANSLSNANAVYPGLVVRVPDQSASENQPEMGSSNRKTHTVSAGETLTRIAIQYGVTVDGIMAANGLNDATSIYAGQVLNLPAPGQRARPSPAVSAVTHLVAAGQTLSQIAARYGVTLQTLALANGIANTGQIFVGQVLTIPSAQAGSMSVIYASVGEGLCTDAEVKGAGTGYFIRPTKGYIQSQNYHSLHPGVDLALDTGNPVYASDSGTVVFAGWNPVGYGNLIVLDHGNGWRTYYAHLSQINVACGDWVPRAETIGEIGSTGNSTGPHLHFEMLRYGIPVNPVGYIRFP